MFTALQKTQTDPRRLLRAVEDFASETGRSTSEVLRDFQESQILTLEQLISVRHELARQVIGK